MTTSLKSCLPVLARVLGESDAALYERQRLLVREGLLESVAGHGPGTGVRATSESVAMLLIGMLSSVNWSESGPAARAIADTSAKPPCRLTGATRFADALAKILSNEALAARVNSIRVTVTGGSAEILYDRSSSEMPLGAAKKAKLTHAPISVFEGRESKKGGLRIEVAIQADTVRALAKAVTSLQDA